MNKTRIYIAEDQALTRELLANRLGHETDLEVIGSCDNGMTAIDEVTKIKPDVLILDLVMPEVSGQDVLKNVKRISPSVKILVYSVFNDPGAVRDLLDLGADGFLDKNSSIVEMIKAIRTIIRGERYLHSTLAELIQEHTSRSRDNSGTLTEREQRVLILIAQGKSTKEIATELNISTHTVDNHRTNLRNKLNVRDVASATRYALEKGLILPKPQN